MTDRLRRILRRFPPATAAYEYWMRRDIEILDAMPTYAPFSAGHPQVKSRLALQAAQQTPELLHQVAVASGLESLVPVSPEEFAGDDRDLAAEAELKALFDRYHSDKADRHDYHKVYSVLVRSLGADDPRILEVGLGTNNEDVVSTMGAGGTPGASLRAFRDVLSKARVYGADIDRRILFSEERIETFYVDQTDDAAVAGLARELPDELDLVIDDGLHTPNANLRILLLGMQKVRVGGWVVIEDIEPAMEAVWQVVRHLLPTGWDVHYVRARGGDMFVMRRTA